MTGYRRFVAVGDSFVEGLDDRFLDTRYLGWADRFAFRLDELSDHDVAYANFAIRGKRLPEILTEQLPAALELQPDLLCLEGGVNDTMRPQWEASAARVMLEYGILRAQRAGADVMLFTYGDSSHRSKTIGLLARRIRMLSEITSELADQHGCFLVDLAPGRVFYDERAWAEDRLHLNALGHERAARGAAHFLGIEPDPGWDDPLPPIDPVGRGAKFKADLEWTGQHLAPWIGRRVRRKSSGAGVKPKFEQLVQVAGVREEVEWSTAS